MGKDFGGYAFPLHGIDGLISEGMNERDYFAAQAITNPELCSGTAKEYELRAWFGERGGIRREEIAAAQAYAIADAMLVARQR